MGTAPTLPQEVLQAFEAVPDLYLILTPDLVVLTASDAYVKASLSRREVLVGKPLEEVFPGPAGLPAGEMKWNLQASLRQVLRTKKPHQMDPQTYTLDRPEGGQLGRPWRTLTTPVLDERGEIRYLILKVENLAESPARPQRVADREQEARQRHQDIVEQADDKYLSLLNNIHQGFCIIEMIFDGEGEPADYRFLEVNPAFERQSGLKNAVGRTMREIEPDHEEYWFQIYGNIVKTGQPLFSEQEAQHLAGSWYELYAFRTGGEGSQQVAVLFNDITERKKAERELQEGKELLQAILDGAPSSITSFKPVMDEAGNVVDVRYQAANKMTEVITGRPLDQLLGRGFLELFPGAKENGVFDRFLTVLKTGEPYRDEMPYLHPEEGVSGYFMVSLVKQGEALVWTVLDITERKKAEQELLRQYQVLRQAEEVARMSSWEYDIASGELILSEGIYRLLRLPVGSRVTLKAYQNHVIEEDRPIADRIIRHLRESPVPFEETMRIRVAGQELSLKVKATVVRDEQGQPLKILGVNVDVTEVKRLEQENLELRLHQQKALLLAILKAQEEERRRISESLHNGVGQMLYATKLHLEQIAQGAPWLAGAEKQALQITEKLLTEAINETRRVSHELVPVLLKDFGLQEALYDFCRNYNQSSLTLRCQVEGLPGRLEDYLEVALYRTSQELVNNIVKHAGATQASIRLSRDKDHLLLQVQDNGKGFRYEKGKLKGLGLRTIHDRVTLLKGTLSISPPKKGKGTLVSIRVPVEG